MVLSSLALSAHQLLPPPVLALRRNRPRGPISSLSHPAAEFLKHKRYILYIELDPAVATTPKLLGEIVTRFEAMAPLVEYLNRPLLKQHAKRKRDKQFLE